VFRAAIGVFMGGSILCALSGSLLGFVVARFIQGMGGAMMVPIGRLVVLRNTPKEGLVQAWNYLTMPALVGPVLGPPLGGFISTYLHWRWIFFINIPISIIGIVLAGRFIENLKEKNIKPLDWRGFIFSALGLSSLMLGLALMGRHLVPTSIALSGVVLGIILVSGYVWSSRNKAFPLLNLKLFGIPTFQAGVVGGFFFRIGVGAIPFLLPLFLQLFESGMLTFASAAGALIMKTFATRILARFGFRPVLLGNGILAGLSFAAIGSFTAYFPHLAIVAILLVGGCFRSLQFTSLNALSYGDVNNDKMSQATSLASVMQQLSAGMGITVGALALQGVSAWHGHAAVTASDFRMTFILVALVSVCSLFWMFRLSKDAGDRLSGHKALAEEE